MQGKLIGLTGKAGCGKDTVADYLKANANFKSIAFADPIRAGMKAMLGLDDSCFQHPRKEVVLEEFGKSPRQMMQTLGTEYGRECVHKDLWLILAGKKIKKYMAEGFNVAITDVRFENEAKFVRELGGSVWHVHRKSSGTQHAHVSEGGVEFLRHDVLVDNNWTLTDLIGEIKWLMLHNNLK